MPPTIRLTMRDVLHFAPPDTNPVDPVIPFEFLPSTPNPMIAVFTSLGFCDFWRQERQAYDWEYRANRFTGWYKSSPSNRDLDLLLPDKSEQALTQNCRSGPRIRYDWTIRYDCRRWRKPGNITRGHVPVGAN
ncbi:hypothetical protein BGZ79_005806, partial [Entomortierella chlamydospora]